MADADGRAMNSWRKATYSDASAGQRFLLNRPLENGVLVAVRVPLEDHELGLEEVRQALVHALAADAGLLEPAEADAEVGPHRVVPDGAGPEPSADLAGPVDVVGEHRGVEPVDGVVGDPHRVVLVGGRDHRQHRAEDLLLGDDRAVVDVAEDRRLDVPAALEVPGTAAAG